MRRWCPQAPRSPEPQQTMGSSGTGCTGRRGPANTGRLEGRLCGRRLSANRPCSLQGPSEARVPSPCNLTAATAHPPGQLLRSAIGLRSGQPAQSCTRSRPAGRRGGQQSAVAHGRQRQWARGARARSTRGGALTNDGASAHEGHGQEKSPLDGAPRLAAAGDGVGGLGVGAGPAHADEPVGSLDVFQAVPAPACMAGVTPGHEHSRLGGIAAASLRIQEALLLQQPTAPAASVLYSQIVARNNEHKVREHDEDEADEGGRPGGHVRGLRMHGGPVGHRAGSSARRRRQRRSPAAPWRMARPHSPALRPC